MQACAIVSALTLAITLCSTAGQAFAGSSEYNPAHCQEIAGTLNIQWELLPGSCQAPCTGIEFTDGTLADAADGTVTMHGVSPESIPFLVDNLHGSC